MHTLRSLFFILVALTLGAPQSRAVAWAISFRQYDGSNVPRQVEFTPAANSLVGFSGTGQVVNITPGSGISISGNVISATGGGGGGGGNVTASSPFDASYLTVATGAGSIATIPELYMYGGNLNLLSSTFHAKLILTTTMAGMSSGLNLGVVGRGWDFSGDSTKIGIYDTTAGVWHQENFAGTYSTAYTKFSSNKPSTSPSTGAVVIGSSGTTAGLGVLGNINAGGTIGASNFSGSSSGTNTGDQQAFANIIVGNVTIAAGGTAGNLTLVPGSGITLTPSGTGNRTITISSTGGVGGGGTVTITGTATANAIMIGNGGSDLKASSATIDAGGNITTTGTIQAANIVATSLDVGTLNLTNSIPITKGGTGGNSTATAWVNLTIPSVTTGGASIDWAAGPSHSRTLAANTTFTFSNAIDGQTIIVAVTNTASNYTVTWPTVQWAGGAAPTQTVGAKTDVYTFTKVGSTIYGAASQNHF